MRPFQSLFLVFLLVPLVEIYLLIKVGSIIGALPTVFMVVFTAVLGAFLLRLQGFATLAQFQRSLAQGELPATTLIEGALLLLAGALLLTPGFFTDAVGFILLVPPLRRRFAGYLLRRGMFGMVHGGRPPGGWGPGRGAGSDQGGDRGPRTIEGQFHRDE